MILPQPSRRHVLLAGAGGLAAVALSGTGTGTAHASEAVTPDIDGTAQWKARAPQSPVTLVGKRPTKIIVHHTVSDNTSDVSRAQAHRHAHWVQDLHMDQNGWSDTGYHFLVSRGGWITEGRHRSLSTLQSGNDFVMAAHTSGQNDQAIGIANEGAYHDGAQPPRAQWEVLVAICAYVCEQYAIAPSSIYGHKDFGDTLCPGVLHDKLPQLRSEVAASMG
ncbi:peptidoglycan recognition family protein [Streptomyces sp. NPDC091289]|uniref:peptidoglycan recognition protein family protein n=1 Tax=Streptomyces sp. NPDC091289 TaxID=3365989 RepID=UPI0037F9034D